MARASFVTSFGVLYMTLFGFGSLPSAGGTSGGFSSHFAGFLEAYPQRWASPTIVLHAITSHMHSMTFYRRMRALISAVGLRVSASHCRCRYCFADTGLRDLQCRHRPGEHAEHWSNTYRGFPPAGGSSFEFLLLQSHCILSRPPTPVFLCYLALFG